MGPRALLLLLFVFALSEARAYDELDPFVPFDPFVTQVLCGELLEKSSPFARFVTEGYTYVSSPGVILDDNGFIPSVYWLPATLRKITLHGKVAKVDREIERSEIDAVRRKAREAVLDSYEEKIQPEIRALVNKIEDGIRPENVSFGVVRDEKGGIVGVVRFAKAEFRDGKVRLPALDILRERGLLSPDEELAIAKRFGYVDGYAGTPPVEIGQLFIEKTLSADDREAVRDRLFLWIASHLALSSEAAPIVGHTSRIEHYNLWAKTFDLREKVIEKVDPIVTETVTVTTIGRCLAKVRARLSRH